MTVLPGSRRLRSQGAISLLHSLTRTTKFDFFAKLEKTSLEEAAGVVMRLVRNDGMESGGRTQCQAAPLLVFSLIFQLQSSSMAGSQLALVYIQLPLATLSRSKTFPTCSFLRTQNHETSSINRPTTDLPNNISTIFLPSNSPQPFDCDHGRNGRNIGRIAVCKDHGRLARLRGAGE